MGGLEAGANSYMYKITRYKIKCILTPDYSTQFSFYHMHNHDFKIKIFARYIFDFTLNHIKCKDKLKIQLNCNRGIDLENN